MNVKNLIEKKNKIEAKIASIESGIVNSNTQVFIEEVLNFLDKVGEYIPDDYWAPSRLYSRIEGVKNLGVDSDRKIIWVKIVDPRGRLLPEKVTVRNVKYDVDIFESSKFEDSINY